MNEPRTVVILGKGTLAIRIAEWFHGSKQYRLQAVVPVVPEPTWTDSLTKWARLDGVAVAESGQYTDVFQIIEEPIDLAFSVFYDKILPGSFIEACGRVLNIHNGPLPRYRGVSPINWALKNNEQRHGITIHEITPGIDDGPIVAQLDYTIYPEFDEVIDVYGRAMEYGWTLFHQTISLLDQIQPVPQDNTRATYFRRQDDELLGDRRYFTRAESLKRDRGAFQPER